MRIIELEIPENGLSEDIAIDPTTWGAISNLRFQPRDSGVLRQVVEIVPGSKRGLWKIRANSIVGVVTAGRLQISILPKCGSRNLAGMLNSVGSAVHLDRNDVSAAGGNLVKYIASVFVSEVERQTSDGLAEGYVRVDETGNRPVGRIEFGKFGNGLPLPVRYSREAFTSDIAENQLLRASLVKILSTFGIASEVGGRSYRLLDRFEVSPFNSEHTQATRLNNRIKRYVKAVALGATILTHGGVEPQSGPAKSPGILFSMPEVYEDFITSLVVRIADECGLNQVTQGRGKPAHFARSKSDREMLRIKPDFELWTKNGPLLVGDVKYKVRKNGIPRSDLYQVFAYAEVLKVATALLVYVGAAAEQVLTLPHGSMPIQVHIVSIDLDTLSPENAYSVLFETVLRLAKVEEIPELRGAEIASLSQ